MKNQKLHIEINLARQILKLMSADNLIAEYQISTAKRGAGEQQDSECTPRGQHIIAEKIGDTCEANTVFTGRQATGEIYTLELREKFPGRDWILTRILWLSGMEEGKNKGGNVDSRDRYIYIHGSPEDVMMGVPGSRGCIRMRNADVLEIFDLVEEGTPVNILEE